MTSRGKGGGGGGGKIFKGRKKSNVQALIFPARGAPNETMAARRRSPPPLPDGE